MTRLGLKCLVWGIRLRPFACRAALVHRVHAYISTSPCQHDAPCQLPHLQTRNIWKSTLTVCTAIAVCVALVGGVGAAFVAAHLCSRNVAR